MRIVVAFAAGGTTDIVARVMGHWLSERLRQQFIVENRPCGSGNIGTEAVVRAASLGTALLGPMGVGGSGPTTPGAFPTGNSSWGRGLSRMTSNCPRCYHSMMLARTITIPRPKKFIFLCSDSDATR